MTWAEFVAGDFNEYSWKIVSTQVQSHDGRPIAYDGPYYANIVKPTDKILKETTYYVCMP